MAPSTRANSGKNSAHACRFLAAYTRFITSLGDPREITKNQIKKGLKLKKGPFAPASLDYANSIIDVDSIKHTFSLKEPLSVVFVALKRWQLDEE
jgi:hypothetical protein